MALDRSPAVPHGTYQQILSEELKEQFQTAPETSAGPYRTQHRLRHVEIILVRGVRDADERLNVEMQENTMKLRNSIEALTRMLNWGKP
ncbi:hypothetical protein Trydic_g14819 [Trypoxylus dichotomus]